MTQGDPLSPIVFNVVVDAVIQNWVSVVAEVEGGSGPEGFGRDIHWMAA